jgi:hypothetical protein
MLLVDQSFGKYVSDLVVGGDVGEVDVTSSDPLAQEMVMQINMLHAIMELGVLSNGDSGLIVHVQDGGEYNVKIEFLEETLEPDSLLHGVCGCDIFGFHAGQCDRGLLFRSPANSTPSEHEDETRGGFSVVNVTGLVSIHETTQGDPIWSSALESEVKGQGSLQIFKDTVQRKEVG